MLIDKISYGNPIKDMNPGIKFILSMTTLIFLLYTGSKVVFIFNLILFNLLLLFVVKVKISDLLKLNFIPAFIFITFIFSNSSGIFSYLFDTRHRFGLYICKIEISQNIQGNVPTHLQIYISVV